MSYQESKIKYHEDLHRAAGFDANQTYPALFQHLGYRKRIAYELLHSDENSEHFKTLTDLYLRVNFEIKLILGIN